MDPVSDWYCASVSVTTNVISYNIESHYNGTTLYLVLQEKRLGL